MRIFGLVIHHIIDTMQARRTRIDVVQLLNAADHTERHTPNAVRLSACRLLGVRRQLRLVNLLSRHAARLLDFLHLGLSLLCRRIDDPLL